MDECSVPNRGLVETSRERSTYFQSEGLKVEGEVQGRTRVGLGDPENRRSDLTRISKERGVSVDQMSPKSRVVQVR